jgi:hypothetical protein
MVKNWNLPLIHEQPFASIDNAREVAVVYTNPARDAVADRVHIRPVWQMAILWVRGLFCWRAFRDRM